MYHFVPQSHMLSVRYSNCQYLKSFQLEAVQFLQSHHDQQTFCVLNDESGLGKTATMSVFLNNVVKRRCLIIVQNDEDRITNWRFHLSLLTNLPTIIIGDITELNENGTQTSICLIKWSTLQAMDINLYECNFDIVVIDNRGEMLNNAFCCTSLMKHFQQKVNVVISNIDITSNVKVLHTILKLGGRLKENHLNYKAFEKKFNLPDIKSISLKTFDLEEYFAKREMISVYCREFRLRRYRQQFEQMLPLIDMKSYKKNLELWRKEEQMNANFSIIEDTNYSTVFETEELLKKFYKDQLAVNKAVIMHTLAERNKCTVDDDERMSPLVFISDSETDHYVNEIILPFEVIDLTKETDRTQSSQIKQPYINNTQRERTEVNTKVAIKTTAKSCSDFNNHKGKDTESKPDSNFARAKLLKVKLHRCSQPTVINNKLPSTISENVHAKRKMYKKLSKCPHKYNVVNDIRETRSMMRCTRSSRHLRNRYMRVKLALNDTIKRKYKPKNVNTKGIIKTPKETTSNDDQNANRTKNSIKQTEKCMMSQQKQNISQISVITKSDYSDIECAQRLSYDSNLPTTDRVFRRSWDEFAVPILSENELLTTHAQLSASENESTNNDVIVLSSTHPNISLSQNHRTRPLKCKRSIVLNSDNTVIKAPSSDFVISTKNCMTNTNTITSHYSNKSPDLFSNCSDLELLYMQDRNMFNTFGICEVEAKTMQQPIVHRQCLVKRLDVDFNKIPYPKSCLDVLEALFDIRQTQELMTTSIRSNTHLLPPQSRIVVSSNSQAPLNTRVGNHKNRLQVKYNKIADYSSNTANEYTCEK